jgi:hypothetical protein
MNSKQLAKAEAKKSADEWRLAQKNLMKQFREISRYIKKQAKLRASQMMKAYKAEQRKLKSTKKNQVAIYKPVSIEIVSVSVLTDDCETSVVFKTNLSNKLYNMLIQK